ncbi:unnamed protein product [Meganyctiphanes norvegica]|uniref:C2H2-type domain-containing protein n=1 Tax=Meganyctiphanes norvegica TaxID=48144 RepID=A0AAV2Q000_MEGNR
MSPNTPLSLPYQTSNSNESSPVSSNSFISSLMERFKMPSKENDAERGTSLMERFNMPPKDNCVDRSTSLTPSVASGNNSALDLSDRPLSPQMTASSIASSFIRHTDSPPRNEPNSLEMLQRTANQVLNKASQGLLTNRLIDDHKPNDKDPYYKNRCRYCGKVFGSDSGLQIHIRSHTGERPFKCSICGNRFTTRGNLKVHFQRHQQCFPHVKMNTHPIPEHLDKFHPPLLAKIGEMKDYPPPPTGPPNQFSSLLPTGPRHAGLSPVGLSPAGLPPYRLPGPPPFGIQRPFNLLNLVRHSNIDKDEPKNVRFSEDLLSPGRQETNLGNRSREQSLESEELPIHSNYEPKQEINNDFHEDMETLKKSDTDINYNSERNMSVDHHYDPASILEQNLRMSSPDREINTNCIEDENGHIKDELQDEHEQSISTDCEVPIEPPLVEHEHELSVERQDDVIEDRAVSSEREHEIRISEREQYTAEQDQSGDEPSLLDIRIRSVMDLKENTDSNLERLKDDSNDSQSTLDQSTDLSIPRDFRPLGLSAIPFSAPRFNFPFMPGFPPTSMAGPMGSLGPMGPPGPPPIQIPNGVDPSKDPTIYNHLLPRPGSTDNSWEVLIEVQKASETMKLEQLVNNIENKLTDPNQCIICHRVLSCKSSLHLHYRTHTGERPYKCKICGRAFTTKGNLKIHMGVHRGKAPMRMAHQCPLCRKKYTNALVLQQHIRQHTGEPTDLTPDQIAAAEVRDFPPMNLSESFPGLLPPGFPLPPHMMQGFPSLPLHLLHQLSPDSNRIPDDRDDTHNEEEKYLRHFSTSSRSSSTGSAEQRTAEDLTIRSKEESFNGITSPRSPRRSVSPTPSDYSDLGEQTHDIRDETQISPAAERRISGSVSPAVSSSSQDERSTSSAPLDLASRLHPHIFSPFGLFPPPLTSAGMRPETPSLPGMNPLHLLAMPGRGITTCHICFKTFACQSALEIHIRSHTKERPYKCTLCDRGFSTKGNMNQHMLAHKIRDSSMSQDVSISLSNSNAPTGLESPIASVQALSATMTTPSLHPPISSPLQAMLSMASPLRSMPSPIQARSSPLGDVTSPFTSNSSPIPFSASIAALLNQAREGDKYGNESCVKRELEGEKALPVPKRPSGVADDETVESQVHQNTVAPNIAPSPSPLPEITPLPT